MIVSNMTIMAFGTHNISSNRYNRNLQHDYKSRAQHRKEALKTYFSKVRRSGTMVKDHLSSSERTEIRSRLTAVRKRGLMANVVVLILTFILLYSMVSYLS